MLILDEQMIVQEMQQGVTGATCDPSIDANVYLSIACCTAEEHHYVRRQSHIQTYVGRLPPMGGFVTFMKRRILQKRFSCQL